MNITNGETKPASDLANLKTLVENKIIETLLRAQEIYKRAFDIPAIVYRDMGVVAGLAYRNKNQIDLSPTLLRENGDKFINRTVPHEIAHLICFIVWPGTSAHGPEWKGVMRRLGLEPSRCHSYDTTSVSNTRPRPYTYVCKCSEHKLTANLHFKIQLGRNRFCRLCKAKIQWKKLL
jgi:SprT protein